MQVFKAVVSFFNKITKDTQEVSLWRRDMVPQNIIRVLLAGVFFFYSTVCYALPEGYQVQAGTAEFNQPDSNTLNIDTSDRVIINYNSFSIANPEAVNFNQPGGDSVSLNRVTGGSISEILGTLTANGKIFLVNPNGVLFGPNSSVDTTALVASTLDIDNVDFMNSNYTFREYSDKIGASIINQGYIQAKDVALIGQAVNNEGTIVTTLGSTVLASGSAMTLSLDTVGMISVAIDEAVKDKVIVNGEEVDSAVKNTGEIKAEGGVVVLTAKTMDDIFDYAVNNEGIIQAKSLVSKEGEIYLSAAGVENSVVLNRGTLDVSGKETSASGGKVEMYGPKVGQFGEVYADALGEGDGGTITLYGNDAVALTAGSITTANANVDGSGGEIIVYSPETALFWSGARIEAKGGSSSGDGGFVEVSGKEYLLFKGNVDTSALMGENGTLLIDPDALEIVTSGSSTATWVDHSDGFDYDSSNQTKISPVDVTDELYSNNVLLLATNAITVTDALIYDRANDLKLQTTAGAGNAIIINAAITNAGAGDLIFDSGTGDVDLNAAISSQGGDIEISGVNVVIDGDIAGSTLVNLNADELIKITGSSVNATVDSGTAKIDMVAGTDRH